MKQPGEEKKRTGSLADGNRQDVCHHVFGTGNALAARCYNTCFTLHGSGDTVLWSALDIVLIGIFVLRWEWL